MKKILSVILSIALCFSLATTAFATPNEPNKPIGPAAYTAIVNEYDVYVEVRNATAEELLSNGVSESCISVINSDAIENKLLEMAALPADELLKLGYTSSQIRFLYKGIIINHNKNRASLH